MVDSVISAIEVMRLYQIAKRNGGWEVSKRSLTEYHITFNRAMREFWEKFYEEMDCSP